MLIETLGLNLKEANTSESQNIYVLDFDELSSVCKSLERRAN